MDNIVISKNIFNYSLIKIGIIFVNIVLLIYGVNYEYQYYMSIISAIFFIMYLVVLYKYRYEIFILAMPFYMSQLGTIASNVLIEKGTYLTELMTYSYTTGSTIKLVFYNIIFFEIISLIFCILTKNIKIKYKYNKKICNLILCLVSTLIIISFIGLIIDGVPIFMKIDRIQYVNNYQSFIFNKVSGQLYIGVFVLGMICGISYISKDIKIFKRCVFMYCCVIVYFILRGDKFSGLVNIIYLFFIPLATILYKYQNFKPKISKLIIVGIVLGIIFLSIINYHYSNINKSESTDRVKERISAQGQVWWAIDRSVSYGNEASSSEISNEIRSYFNTNIDKTDIGLNKLMKVIAPMDISNSFIKNKVNFTMGYPAIGLYLYGYIGLILFQIIYGILLAICIIYMYKIILSRDYFSAIIIGKIYIEMIGSLSMGNLYNVFSKEVLIYILILIFFYLVQNSKKKYKVEA